MNKPSLIIDKYLLSPQGVFYKAPDGHDRTARKLALELGYPVNLNAGWIRIVIEPTGRTIFYNYAQTPSANQLRALRHKAGELECELRDAVTGEEELLHSFVLRW